MDPMGAAGAAIPQEVPPMKEDDYIKKVMAQEPCDMKLNVKQANDKVVEMEDCFLCPPFCTMIPYELRRCSNLSCLAYYCEDCIKQWLARPNTQGRCPNCQKINKDVPYLPLNIFEKQQLNRSKLSGCGSKDCTKSQNPMTYEQFMNHLSKECLEVMIECPLGCLQKFQKKVALEHYMNCPETTGQCEICKNRFQKTQRKQHEDNCNQFLREQIRLLKLRLEESEQKVLVRDQTITNLQKRVLEIEKSEQQIKEAHAGCQLKLQQQQQAFNAEKVAIEQDVIGKMMEEMENSQGLIKKLEQEIIQLKQSKQLSLPSPVKLPKINTQTLVNSLKSLQITKKIQLQDDPYSLTFIVKEGQQNTVYAGDYNKKQLLVISKLSTKPVVIDIQYSPDRGQLAMGESLLLVGCQYGSLLVYSLNNVLAPALTYPIQLKNSISSMSKLNEQVFVVGQYEGYLSVVDIVTKKKTTIQHLLNHVYDIANTEKHFACACKKGLLIVSAKTRHIEQVSTHKPGTNINCIEYVRDSIVILGLWGNNQLEVFNYSNDQVVQSISNPSANTYPRRIVRMNEDCFIIRDSIAISVIDINSSLNSTLIQSIETNDNGFYVDSRDPNLIILHVGECQHQGKIDFEGPFKRNYLEFSMRAK